MSYTILLYQKLSYFMNVSRIHVRDYVRRPYALTCRCYVFDLTVVKRRRKSLLTRKPLPTRKYGRQDSAAWNWRKMTIGLSISCHLFTVACYLWRSSYTWHRDNARHMAAQNDYLQSQMRQVEMDTIDVISFLKTQDQKKDAVVTEILLHDITAD